MTPACEKTLAVTPGGPLKDGLPTADIHLLPWTYRHIAAWVIEKYAGGKVTLDRETIADLARFKLRDDFVGPASFVLTSKEIRGPM